VTDELIGFEFADDDGKTWRVTGFWDINQAYVLVFDGYQEMIRPAGVVRQRKLLDSQP
jgi:hypothetical protein